MKLSNIKRKFIESYSGNGRTVLTPSGYKEILQVHKTVPYRKFKIVLANGLFLDCAHNHVVIDEANREHYAENTLGVILQTELGLSEVINVINLEIEEHMYDISIDSDDELYYSNGILSHNSGKSVTSAIYLAHMYNFKRDINIGIVANKGPMAREFLANTKNILIELPVWMQQGSTVWNKGSIENESKMRILTDVPSSDSFRGFTISCLDGNSKVNVYDKKDKCYKTISLAELHSCCIPSNSIVLNDRFLIETPQGYNDFIGVQETTNTGLIITHTGGEIRCTKEHLILVNGEFVEAQDLRIGQLIENFEITNIKEDNIAKKYYDPVHVNGDHTYISENITHHNCLVIDEAAYLKSQIWEEFSDAIFPSQSGLAWKKNIILSTANGMNFFYKMVQGARDKSNGMIIHEVDWKDVPRYKSDGTQMTNDEFMNKIVSEKGILHFNQAYANEFLGSSHTLISSDKLSTMKASEIHEIRDGKLNIYHYPEKNHRYIMTVDAAKDGNDAFAVQIVDITDFKFVQVATAKLQIDYLLMPEFLNEWAEYYNNPYLIIENNEGAGQSVADQMYQDYEYENLHFDKDVGRNKKKKYPGFRTTTKTRKQMLQTMKLFIENDKLEVQDKNTITEFLQFILINNKFQADDGAHDDMIMSLAMVFVPFCNTKNFEDMRKLISALYDDDPDKSEKVNFGDLLTIGSFDSGLDEDYIEMGKKEYNTYDEALSEYDGFI